MSSAFEMPSSGKRTRSVWLSSTGWPSTVIVSGASNALLCSTPSPPVRKLFDRPAGQNRFRPLGEDVAARMRFLVPPLDAQPLALALAGHLHEDETAAQLFALQPERHVAGRERAVHPHLPAVLLGDVAIGAAVPDDHRAG